MGGKRVVFSGVVIRTKPKGEAGVKPKTVAKLTVVRDSLPNFEAWMEKGVAELKQRFPNATIQGTLLIKK